MVEDGCQHRQSEEAKIKSLSIRNGVHIGALVPFYQKSDKLSHFPLRNRKKVRTQYHSEKEIIFQLFTFADTDVFFLACEIHLCQDQYCSMPTRSQVLHCDLC